jgi:hypothetical protein
MTSKLRKVTFAILATISARKRISGLAVGDDSTDATAAALKSVEDDLNLDSLENLRSAFFADGSDASRGLDLDEVSVVWGGVTVR